jgi:predicted Zn-dependent protease with MMP-like domain
MDAWKDRRAPTLDEFQAMAEEAWLALPAQFRALCGDVVLAVQDFAADDVLHDMGIENPFELSGLYQGVDLTQKSVMDSGREPDMVFLYRRPLLDEWCENGEITLPELITHVLVHEIGHHFGLSDDAMHRIEDTD